MDTWRSDVFFSVGEAATSKWTHGEVAVYGSTVYKIFALKCQKLRTPLASLAPCVMNVKGVTHGPGPMFASKRLKTDPRKMPFKSV